MKTCPHCALINPDTALRCDCGFDFTAVADESMSAEFQWAQGVARVKAFQGLAIGVGAIAILLGMIQFGFAKAWHLLWVPIVAGLGLAGRSINRLVELNKASRKHNQRMGRMD